MNPPDSLRAEGVELGTRGRAADGQGQTARTALSVVSSEVFRARPWRARQSPESERRGPLPPPRLFLHRCARAHPPSSPCEPSEREVRCETPALGFAEEGLPERE